MPYPPPLGHGTIQNTIRMIEIEIKRERGKIFDTWHFSSVSINYRRWEWGRFLIYQSTISKF